MKLVTALLLFSFAFVCSAWPGSTRDEMLVSTQWLSDNLQKVVLVHVSRDRAKYDAGHIPGARYADWKEVAVLRDGVMNELPPLSQLVSLIQRLGITGDDHVVIYDDETGIPAARAYFAFDYAGLSRVSMLNGQLKKWVAEKRPVTKQAPEVQPSSFAARPRPGILVPFQAMQDFSWTVTNTPSAAVALIDARPEAEYSGEKPGEEITRPGHIPGAKSLFWMKQLVSVDDPELRSPQELRAMYEQAGAKQGDTVITYCRTGGQSSYDYFVAKYLGYDVRMYDGSYSEWSGKKDTQVAR